MEVIAINISFSQLKNIKRFKPRDQGHYLPFDSYPHGAPLGGFGAGTLSRSPFGNFNIYHIKVGAHICEDIKANNFHCFVADEDSSNTCLLAGTVSKDDCLKKFAKPLKHGQYSASYPLSGYEYDFEQIKIKVDQFSPVIAHNYRESSYPVAVFRHKITNTGKKTKQVSIMFTFANMTGWGFEDQRPGVQDSWYRFVKNNQNSVHRFCRADKLHAVVMGNLSDRQKATNEMDGQMAIGCLKPQNGKVSYKKKFYAQGTAEELYNTFSVTGELDNKDLFEQLPYQSYASALAVKVTVLPGESVEIPFFLAWDLPIINFGQDDKRFKYYTKFFDKSGHNAFQLIQEAADNYLQWEQQIRSIQELIKNNSLINKYEKRSDYYFKALFNELYYLADGGTYWDADSGDFGMLECLDYPFYETLDVRFYGSAPLIKFWPKIELSIMDRFSQEVLREDRQKVRYHHYAGNDQKIEPQDRRIYFNNRLFKGAVPHDLGNPKEAPFIKTNAYVWQNSNFWKDLNSKYILLMYRDYFFTKDLAFIKRNWPAILAAAEYLLKMDHDQDGIPENENYPDQTYDNWLMKGVSAYCGSLWLGAVSVIIKMAELLDDQKNKIKYQKILTKAVNSFDSKLWNGKYYNFSEGDNTVMSEQVIGMLYLSMTNEQLPIAETKIKKILDRVYKNNFNRYYGLVSGRSANGKKIQSEQGNEIWVGANYAVATLMMHLGLPNKALKIIKSIAKITYQRGFFFRTPEGWNEQGEFTATMYMRPGAIWLMEL